MTIENTSRESINRSQLFTTKAILNGIIGVDLNSLNERKVGIFGETEEVIKAKGRRDAYDLCNTLKSEHTI